MKSAIQYQVRNIGGDLVFYKRKKPSDLWSFIDEKEFNKDSTIDNIVSWKSDNAESFKVKIIFKKKLHEFVAKELSAILS